MGYESSLSGNNLEFLEALYEAYQADPSSVDPAWVPLFRELEAAPERGLASVDAQARADDHGQSHVDNLIDAYRHYGHMKATLDPLGRERRHVVDDLEPAFHQLTDADMDRSFDPGSLMPAPRATLRDIYTRLQNTYSRNIGVEYSHIRDSEQRAWLQSRMEACENHVVPDETDQRVLLNDLVQVENVDKFLHSKFLGAKRFSISGAESIIALLDCMIEEGGALGVNELILGMAHRGRLNVLMNIMGKKPEEVFSEFQKSNPWESLGSGDVKYHLGHHRYYTTRKGHEMYLALMFNPSHLEAITPVVQGRVRAKQDSFASVDDARARVLGVTLHGDAAFAGQGVVQETFNFSRLRGYDVGGMIRIVTNNQVGFTTDPTDSRSTTYATDIAHALQVPVFHVNGDDVEAAAYVAKLAMGFRQRFKRDVIIDLICYRRFGHNEGDDPTYTQPEMYKLISGHPSVRTQYEQKLIERGTVTREDCERIDKNWMQTYDLALDKAKKAGGKSGRRPMHGVWERYHGGLESETPDVPTNISPEQLDALRERLIHIPEGFKVHRKLHRLLGERDKMWRGEQPINWACGELMALASLLAEGAPVRFSGQDVQRGTFSHRHAVYRDNETGEGWSPLDHLAEKQGIFEIFNSPLSEFSVLGFEFGYSLMAPGGLVIWEAQFGDFANGAQVMIDNFITSSEDKWNRLSGLVMLLPHGFEGQGPEHSSARLERFLQMCAEDNMQVCNLTTPAQLFHVLRRQVLRQWRKPLVLMQPKSLLRSRPSFSPVSELTDGAFHRLLDDPAIREPGEVTRLILCSGKVYYDLAGARAELSEEDARKVAIVRVEQLYPFPARYVARVLARYSGAKELVWAQEEPKNMGPWDFVMPRLLDLGVHERFGIPRYIGRVASASPATGSSASHALELKLLLDAAFDKL